MKVDDQNRLLVDVEIEGQRCVLQLDTGASGLSLPHEIIRALQSAKVISEHGSMIPQVGIDPTIKAHVTTYSARRSFRVGGLSVNRDSVISETSERFGLAGNMLFKGKCLTINWVQGAVIIEEQAVIPHGWLILPLIYRWGNVPIVKASLGSEQGLLIVDTGANATVLDAQALQKAGARLMSDGNGVDTLDARMWTVKQLVLKGQGRSSDIVLSETSILGLLGITAGIGVTGGVGVNFPRRFPTVVVDYRDNRLVLAPPEPAGQQAGELDAASRPKLP